MHSIPSRSIPFPLHFSFQFWPCCLWSVACIFPALYGTCQKIKNRSRKSRVMGCRRVLHFILAALYKIDLNKQLRYFAVKIYRPNWRLRLIQIFLKCVPHAENDLYISFLNTGHLVTILLLRPHPSLLRPSQASRLHWSFRGTYLNLRGPKAPSEPPEAQSKPHKPSY